MKQIILFGGSFDPVHDGHINMAKKALDQRGADELWFIPTQVSPFKSKSTDFHHRLAMLNFRCAEDSRFKVCDIEGKEAGPSYTIKTVLALEKDYPDYNFEFLIGDDQVKDLNQWKDYDLLKDLVQFIVYGRLGHDHEFPTIVGDMVHVSSSEIRRGTSTKTSVEVLNYMTTEGLYIDETLKYRLSPKRYEHVIRVKDLAMELGTVHKLNLQQVYLAAMWHDFSKEDLDLRDYVKQHMPHRLDDPKAFYHAYVAAHKLSYDYHYHDAEVLDAIISHVDGSSDSKLAMVLYIADKCEPGRKYDATGLIELSKENLCQGFKEVKREQELFLRRNL